VAQHLVRQGFTIVGRNVRVGRDELDILARRADLLVVCEVRSRSSRAVMDPVESIDRPKQLRIRRAAAAWLRAQAAYVPEVRFDAASVLLPPGGEPELSYFEAAFE